MGDRREGSVDGWETEDRDPVMDGRRKTGIPVRKREAENRDPVLDAWTTEDEI